MFTITPRSPLSVGAPAAMAPAARRITLKVPTRLMRIVFSKSSRGWGPFLPSTFSAVPIPAALTTPCRPEKRSVAAATAFVTSGSLVTSVRTKCALGPSSPASFWPASAFTSRITTLPPAPASMRAVAPPRPEAPPVTRKVLPSMRMAAGSVHEELETPHERLLELAPVHQEVERDAFQPETGWPRVS